MHYPHCTPEFAKAREQEFTEEADRERLIKQAHAGKPNGLGLRTLIWRWLRAMSHGAHREEGQLSQTPVTPAS